MEQMFTLLIGDSITSLFKILVIVVLIFHAVFSVTLLRQVGRMTRVIEAQISPAIYTIALLHLAASLIVFLWAIAFV